MNQRPKLLLIDSISKVQKDVSDLLSATICSPVRRERNQANALHGVTTQVRSGCTDYC